MAMDEILRKFLSEKTTPVPLLEAELRLLPAADSMRAVCRLEDMESRGVPGAAFEFLAQIVSLALYKDGKRMFPWAYELKQQLDPETIVELAGLYSKMMDDISDGEKLRSLKNSLKNCPGERLKWRVLREMGALPAAARDMTDRDYIYCGLNLLIDREENSLSAEVVNPEFDEQRFLAMKFGVGREAAFGG